MSGRPRSPVLVDLPCREHGGIGDEFGCALCLQADSLKRLARDTVPPPPGEHLEDELTGAATIEALHDALVTITKPADRTLTVKDIDFKRIGRFTVAHAELLDGKAVIEFDVRMSRLRAEMIRQRLNTVLDK